LSVEKFEFPARGFYIVATKVGEAEYFLEQLKGAQGHYRVFSYNLSAFVSAVRSITFSMQAVMSKYPNFPEWYALHQQVLKEDLLAKYFLNLRNLTQKVGTVPVGHTGMMRDGEIIHLSYFVSVEELKDAPNGEVTKLATQYFKSILSLVKKCYEDFWAYVDPRAIFTEKGLDFLGWTIEDIEESVGLPRGWTDITGNPNENRTERLALLQREYQGDEMMEDYFSKYELK